MSATTTTAPVLRADQFPTGEPLPVRFDRFVPEGLLRFVQPVPNYGRSAEVWQDAKGEPGLAEPIGSNR